MKTEFELRFERAKKEIEEDIESGLVPKDIKHFYDLDSYVDMNYYGGFIEEGYHLSENFELEDQVQTALNEWLLNGRQ